MTRSIVNGEHGSTAREAMDNFANESWQRFDHCEIGGFRIVTASRATLTEAMVLDCLAARTQLSRPRLVFDVNGHAVSLRETSTVYREAVDQADVVHADGGFLVALSRWLTASPIAERSATTDMIHDFAKAASEKDLSFFLLGGTEEVNAQCVKRLETLYPELRIVGRRHGFFSIDEEDDVISEVNKAKPDILWVGIGKPREQIFSVRWCNALRCGWIITCGGCYNYITGHYSRAPLWMQECHIEWLYRAFTNPRFLWRYATTNPHALWIVLTR